MLKRTVVCLLIAGAMLCCTPGEARKARGARPAGARTVHASFYNAPSRSSFASRHREWRGHTFAITYRGRTVHAVCRDYGPRAYTGREIDVSRDVASRLGFIRRGTAHVHIRRVR